MFSILTPSSPLLILQSCGTNFFLNFNHSILHPKKGRFIQPCILSSSIWARYSPVIRSLRPILYFHMLSPAFYTVTPSWNSWGDKSEILRLSLSFSRLISTSCIKVWVCSEIFLLHSVFSWQKLILHLHCRSVWNGYCWVFLLILECRIWRATFVWPLQSFFFRSMIICHTWVPGTGFFLNL